MRVREWREQIFYPAHANQRKYQTQKFLHHFNANSIAALVKRFPEKFSCTYTAHFDMPWGLEEHLLIRLISFASPAPGGCSPVSTELLLIFQLFPPQICAAIPF